MLKSTSDQVLYVSASVYLLMPEDPSQEEEKRTCHKFNKATPPNGDQQTLFVQ